jgi:adenylate cyclase
MSAADSAVEVNPAERLPQWLRRLVDVGQDPADDPDTRLRKRMSMLVVIISSAIIAAGLLGTLPLGDLRSTVAPTVYWGLSAVGVVHLMRTRRVEVLLYSQLVMVLLLPAVQQWLLGGFVASAGSVLYSMNAALLAVVLVGPRQARWWLISFAAVIAVSGLADGWLQRTVTPSGVPIVLFFVVTMVLVGLIAWLPLAFFVGARHRLVTELDKKNVELQAERRRSEQLLLNILPQEIADRLKKGEHPIADRHQDVAVLFADIVGFTPASSDQDPAEIINTLDVVFSRFDRLAESLRLEKVKTIGDAYLVVAGAPHASDDAVDRITTMAVLMLEAARGLSIGPTPLQLRLGIDVGPVVAGVIGESKFAWDIYGDVVNTAARMESHGLPGEVHITSRVRDRLGPGITARARDPIEIKGKGLMQTYLLDRTTVPRPPWFRSVLIGAAGR